MRIPKDFEGLSYRSGRLAPELLTVRQERNQILAELTYREGLRSSGVEGGEVPERLRIIFSFKIYMLDANFTSNTNF